MITGRALYLFDLVNYLNSADIHCWIRFSFMLHFAWDPELQLPLVHFISAIYQDFSPWRYKKPAAEEMFSSCFSPLVISQKRLVIAQILPTCFLL